MKFLIVAGYANNISIGITSPAARGVSWNGSSMELSVVIANFVNVSDDFIVLSMGQNKRISPLHMT